MSIVICPIDVWKYEQTPIAILHTHYRHAHATWNIITNRMLVHLKSTNFIWISRCDYTNRVETWENRSLNRSHFDVSFWYAVELDLWRGLAQLHCLASTFYISEIHTCKAYIQNKNVEMWNDIHAWTHSALLIAKVTEKFALFFSHRSGFVGFILQSWLHHCFHHNP